MALQATVVVLGTSVWAATAAVLCTLVVLRWALGTRGAVPAPTEEPKPDPVENDPFAPLSGAQGQLETGPTDLDPDADFEAFQAQIGHWCDLELDALCDSAMDDQSAKVLQDLEDEFRGALAPAAPPAGGPGGARCGIAGAGAGGAGPPGLDFEAFPASVELHCDTALEGMCNHVIDDQHAAALKDFEDECGGSSAVDFDTHGDYAKEMEETLSRQAAEFLTIEARCDGAFDVAFEEHHQQLLGELESFANQPVRCVNLLEVIIERVRKAGEFLLWII